MFSKYSNETIDVLRVLFEKFESLQDKIASFQEQKTKDAYNQLKETINQVDQFPWQSIWLGSFDKTDIQVSYINDLLNDPEIKASLFQHYDLTNVNFQTPDDIGLIVLMMKLYYKKDDKKDLINQVMGQFKGSLIVPMYHNRAYQLALFIAFITFVVITFACPHLLAGILAALLVVKISSILIPMILTNIAPYGTAALSYFMLFKPMCENKERVELKLK